jgi:nucleoside 2-deoxyribosyltransferase
MKRPTVYLAGPIEGCTKGEANDWRIDAINHLACYGIAGISPLRCEPIIGERYNIEHVDPKFGTARAIGSKNVFDARTCDMTLVYLPKVLNARRPSYGSIIELAWAHVLGKPTVLVTDDPTVREHPVVNACAGWLLDDLDDGLEVAVGILAAYA